MKKVVFFVCSFFLIIGLVSAKENNRLVIKTLDSHLYYETTYFDNTKFIVHNDMLPGESFEDTLKIENRTPDDYTIYARAHMNGLSVNQKDLLEHINIAIYNGDELLYEGKAVGKEVETDFWSLDYVIPLGYYEAMKNSKLRIISSLDKDFSDTNNKSTANVYWTFYATSDLAHSIVSPNTSDPIERHITVLVASICLFMVAVYLYIRNMDAEKALRQEEKGEK